MTDTQQRPRIVVGVDGSPQGATALEFAIEEARLRGAELHVTYAYPSMASPITGATAHDYYAQVEAEAKDVLQKATAAAPSTEGIEVEWLGVPANACTTRTARCSSCARSTRSEKPPRCRGARPPRPCDRRK